VIVVTAALMLLVQSNNFVMFFVALETVAIGFYILVSYFRTSAASLEAGIKYLILSSLSSAILLFGLVLLYGVAGNRALAGATADAMDFGALRGFLAANPDNSSRISALCWFSPASHSKSARFHSRSGSRRLSRRAHSRDSLSCRRLQGRWVRGVC